MARDKPERVVKVIGRVRAILAAGWVQPGAIESLRGALAYIHAVPVLREVRSRRIALHVATRGWTMQEVGRRGRGQPRVLSSGRLTSPARSRGFCA